MSIISTALSATGIKDYLYGAAIVALIGGFLWYNHHERAIGAAQVVASDQKAVAAQVERDAAVQSIAAVATQLAEKKDEAIIAVTVHNAPLPSRLCGPARSRSPVPGAAGPGPGGVIAPISGNEDARATSELQRFADAAVTIARDADAQVTALQAVDAALRAEMATSTAPAK
jgi:hypothetical protein